MRATTTLGNLIEQVETMSSGNFDKTISLDEMEFASLKEMWIDNVSVDVLPQAQRLLSNRLRVPFSYLSRCPAELQAENLNHWLKQEKRKRDTFYCRFNGQKQLRAAFTTRFEPIDNHEVLVKLLDLGFQHEQEVQHSLSESLMVVKTFEYGEAFEVALKDKVIPGLAFRNSETGNSSFCVECFAYRIVCQNGLIVPVSTGRSRFKHISRKAFDQLPETIRMVADSSSHQQHQMVISANTPVHNPIQTIETFSKRFALNQEEGEMVKKEWEQEPLENMWGVIQAFTSAAKVPWLDVEASYKLERVGGQILASVKQ